MPGEEQNNNIQLLAPEGPFFFLVQCSVIHTDANYSTIIASDHHRLVNIYLRRIKSSRFEQQNRLLIQIKVNKVVCFVGHIGTEVATDDAVPSGAVLLVELLLDMLRDVLLHTVLLERGDGDVDGLLLHVVLHVGALDDDLAAGGGGGRGGLPVVGAGVRRRGLRRPLLRLDGAHPPGAAPREGGLLGVANELGLILQMPQRERERSLIFCGFSPSLVQFRISQGRRRSP